MLNQKTFWLLVRNIQDLLQFLYEIMLDLLLLSPHGLYLSVYGKQNLERCQDLLSNNN